MGSLFTSDAKKTRKSLLILALLVLSFSGVLVGNQAKKRSANEGAGTLRGTTTGQDKNQSEGYGVRGRRDVRLQLSNFPPRAAPPSDVLRFEIVNSSRSTLVCPDGWYLEFDDGTLTNLSLPQSGNIRVNPGGKGAIAITKPTRTNSWRLGASYYLEDIVFKVKVKIDQSPLRNQLPKNMTDVQGGNVLSDWVK